MIYTHVLKSSAAGTSSPLDGLMLTAMGGRDDGSAVNRVATVTSSPCGRDDDEAPLPRAGDALSRRLRAPPCYRLRRASRVRRASLPQQLQLPDGRVAPRGAGRARRRARLRRARHHRRVLARRRRARARRGQGAAAAPGRRQRDAAASCPAAARRMRASCCWRSRGAATATSRTGSRSRAGAPKRAATSRTRATSKARCRTRPCSPACPSAWRCSCRRSQQSFEEVFAHAHVAEDLVPGARRHRHRAAASRRRRRPGRPRRARRRVHRAAASSPPATCSCTCARASPCRTRSPPRASASRWPSAASRSSPTPSSTCARARAWPRSTSRPGSRTRWPSPAAAASRCDELRYEYPRGDRARGRDAGLAAAQAHRRRRCRSASRAACRKSTADRSRTSSRSSPQLKYEAVLPHRRRHRALGARARTSCARAAAAPPTRWSATAWTSPRSTRDRATLLFGRFISVERNEPPDIDIDFEHQRREEVIQYIYGKYGRHRAALTAVVISYRPRSALRDVGRALGIDLQRIEAVSKSQHWFDGRSIAPERLRENGFDPEAPVVRLWMELTAQLIGFPRHLSQHPGGFVIAARPIARAGAGRERDHERPQRHPVGQGRSRRARRCSRSTSSPSAC